MPTRDRRFSTSKPPTENELNSKIHRQFRDSHEGHKPHAGLDPTRASTGVVWVSERAYEHGYLDKPEEWANLGQGAPEVEDGIEGSFERPKTVEISNTGREYGPTAGIKPLREAVANLYNDHHRQGKSSKYTWENVCIVPGGRAGLIRIAAVLGNAYLGFFIPDYTAYNEMLSLFRNFAAIPIPLSREDKYHIHPQKVAEEIARGTSVILTSNPRNPTGQGWRVAWIVGPKEFIKAIGSCGSYLDGGTNVPFQEAAIPMLEPNKVRHEMRALQSHFMEKRDYVVGRLQGMGFDMPYMPNSTFYLWLDLSQLPESIRDGLNFFQACLEEKVTVIPGMKRIFELTFAQCLISIPSLGVFFDLNPSKRRDLFDSPCHHFVRLSYGPRMETLVKGLDAIEKIVKKHQGMRRPIR
ncbi:MAG: hypothetical protein M1821_006271 [Bathelium mastoideum]|nr:MAG: hypothetical protein M1821_006271 [Bathelium mastoideum]